MQVVILRVDVMKEADDCVGAPHCVGAADTGANKASSSSEPCSLQMKVIAN
jgi:hypothetical protein